MAVTSLLRALVQVRLTFNHPARSFRTVQAVSRRHRLPHDQMNVEGSEMRERAARICRDYLHGAWKSVTSKDIQLKRISGGLSNWLFHVALPTDTPPKGSEPSQVLLRIYGQTHGERALEALVTESVIFTLLSERRLGPKLHGIFPGGRIEEYIPARALKTREMADTKLSPLIAERMAQIHRMNVPISKEPRWLWDTMDRWTQSAEAILVEVEGAQPEVLSYINKIQKYNLGSEVKWLMSFLKKLQSPVVFCHNDMQEGNILLYNHNLTDQQALSTPRLVLIDFEYCSYNYRGFDLANHFIEWVYDYTYPTHPFFSVNYSHYPSPEQQLVFARSYLKTFHQKQPTTEEETVLLKEVQAFTLASHLFWGLWAVVNAKLSQIPFGYWEYADARLEAYFYSKSKLLNSAASDIGTKRKIGDLEE
ncbi:choline/ethanolamine kinase isoform X1 [Schistocerca americana]|uniref:choline/ethanolamine kinase isoform X1 n=1 Tax=Schistocerca americana TaxID=7009 RepID=UPI001F4F403B|nr:choline/ethanolamine kinase isoform X1 [Schistocerca americana]